MGPQSSDTPPPACQNENTVTTAPFQTQTAVPTLMHPLEGHGELDAFLHNVSCLCVGLTDAKVGDSAQITLKWYSHQMSTVLAAPVSLTVLSRQQEI